MSMALENNELPLYPGWRIVRKIGAGSFGTVYEIEKESSLKTVAHSALKVISIPETKAEIKAYRDDGYDEASITALFKSRAEEIAAEFALMSKLKGHSNIVSYEDHTVVQHDDDPGYDILIRMELLTPLPDYIGKRFPGGQIPEQTAVKLGADICQALELCGHYNIIHRDIKPQNIFTNDVGDFKLGDFGTAKTVERTSGGTKIGTYNYMAPEVYNNAPYGHGADIYSLGLVLYWLLNERRMPFVVLPPAVPKPSEMDEARLRRLCGDPIPEPAHGSRELKRIVLKACAYDPKDRYASAREMAADLQRLLVEPQEGTSADAANMSKAGEVTSLSDTGDETKSIFTTAFTPITPVKNQSPVDEKPAPEPAANMTAVTAPDEKAPKTTKEKGKKTIIIVSAACILLILAVVLGFALGKKKAPVREVVVVRTESSTPAPTTEPTPEPTAEPTPEPTAEPTPKPTAEPTPTVTPTSKPVTVTYSLDDTMRNLGYEKGERYTGDGLKYMWGGCWFNLGKADAKKYGSSRWPVSGYSPIKVGGIDRSNAIATFHTDSSSTSYESIYGTNYEVRTGSFTLYNDDQYDTFNFSVGALQEPETYYGGPSTHGYIKVRVFAGGKTVSSGWLNYAETKNLSIDISGVSTIRIEVSFAPGNGKSLNAAIYNVSFTKTY